MSSALDLTGVTVGLRKIVRRGIRAVAFRQRLHRASRLIGKMLCTSSTLLSISRRLYCLEW